MGKLQLIDYAMCKHAEGNWISNFHSNQPRGSLRVRNLAWWRSPVIPASSMLIGNQQLGMPGWELALKSLIGTRVTMQGDLRKLSKTDRKRLKAWSDWLHRMQQKHNYMLFRRDLPGFGEPRHGAWDGWDRINTETRSGGILGVFRQDAPDPTRTVVVNHLAPEKEYLVKTAPEGNLLCRRTGKQLAQQGFEVTINKNIDGAIFEVTLAEKEE
jgi:alpha-galactosidase